jgi:hypothetical protein
VVHRDHSESFTGFLIATAAKDPSAHPISSRLSYRVHILYGDGDDSEETGSADPMEEDPFRETRFD